MDKPATDRGRGRIFLVTLLVAVAVPFFIILARFAGDVPSSGATPLAAGAVREGPASDSPAPKQDAVPFVFQSTVRKGETASSLLSEWLSPGEIDLLDRQSKEVFSLRNIRAGRPYLIRTLDKAFQSFEYEIDCEERLVVRAHEGGFVITREPIVYQIETDLVSATIRTSLFEAVHEIHEMPVLALKLADIFGWDVDFALDVREVDSFKVVVEKRYRTGEFAGYGRILAGEFVNQGDTYQGFLFENRDGNPEYYDAKGRSLRRAFLKTPLDYTRISSGFSYHRFHPIKKEWCPHPAIDYAAPVGTPVRTVGDGTVLEAGYNKGSGRYIKIRHNSVYQTYYMHLSRFAKGMRKGSRVRQGQTIGYVGSTGMSTGPHLDFRMKKHGKYVNPRRVIAPASPPVPRGRIEAFREAVDPLLARLDAAAIPVALGASGRHREPGRESGDGRPEPGSSQGGIGGI
jgi:murein DD-endopeptidase MepM/ murein hydrolase activator NlpD